MSRAPDSLNAVIDAMSLDLLFPNHDGSRATRPITERERALQPPLKTVVTEDAWLESLVSNLRETCGERVLSSKTIGRIELLQACEPIAVISNWTTEQNQFEAFQNILRTAVVVVQDLLSLPPDSIESSRAGSYIACIPDLHVQDRLKNLLLTVEMKTPDVLNASDWAYLADKGGENGPWSQGHFPDDVRQHLESMIVQIWCQSIYQSSDNTTGQAVTPRHCVLSNYNQSMFGVRGTGGNSITGDESTLFLTGPLDPKDTFIALIAILLSHVPVTQHSALFKLQNYIGFSGKKTCPATPAPAHRLEEELYNSRADELYLDPGINLTYSFNIRKPSGDPFMFTNQPKLLLRASHHPASIDPFSAPPLSPASARSKSLLGSPNSSDTSKSHLTIIGHLGKGAVGDVYLAQCGQHLVAWKEVDDEFHHSAMNEIGLYEGPLAPLQGTAVPFFYGGYRKISDHQTILLMEYVGQRLPEQRWGDVAPAVRCV
ncbi:hypothetical protein B0H15DRAFT_81900 [Mycena belliarum]|uniref:Uncharacterized protein n=1 Tax=Mycena belliarum TaxID=1033014 RepID=A0AAD6XUB0_9AGAR|nr:hypothetical protein B0H15DRAFT_81900 [Mycena belliae]